MSNWHILNQSAIGEQSTKVPTSSSATEGSGWNTVIVLTDDDDTIWEEIKPKRE